MTGGAGLPAADAATVEIGAYALPMRGINHAMVRSTGSPLQRNLCFSSAFTANALAWSGVCRRSRGSQSISGLVANVWRSTAPARNSCRNLDRIVWHEANKCISDVQVDPESGFVRG